MNSFKRVRAFQVELEFRSVGFWGEGKTGVPGENWSSRNKGETQQQTQSHMVSTPGFEPGPHDEKKMMKNYKTTTPKVVALAYERFLT